MSQYKPLIVSNQSQVPAGAEIIDAYESMRTELFYVTHPQFKKGAPGAAEALAEFQQQSVSDVWIYYPWNNTAVHSVAEQEFFKIRTARNRNIITESEQQAYRDARVGIAGLSVGSSVVSALTMSGGPKFLRIADFDVIELSNLNRLRARVSDIGHNKTHVAARGVYDLDPFAVVDVWDQGVTKDTISQFIAGDQPLHVFIDEMDSIDVKILSRLVAREHKIPVLMATDNGDSIILDVERFDLEPDREIFHGLIGAVKAEDVANLDFRQWLQLATKIVGPEFLTERMQQSLLGIGREIASVPQLGTTAALAGSAMAFAIRRIANNQALPSGRYALGLEPILTPGYNDPEQVAARAQSLEQFKQQFGNHAAREQRDKAPGGAHG